MKDTIIKIALFITLILTAQSNTLQAGCIVCNGNNNNNGSCITTESGIKACVDEKHFFAVRCKSGITSTNDCPSIG